MKTLKLPEKSAEETSIKVEKPPVRRIDPAKRSRSAAPVKAPKPQYEAKKTEPRKSEARKSEARPQEKRYPESRPAEARRPTPGSAYVKPPKALTPDTRAPSTRAINVDRSATSRSDPQATRDKRDLPSYTRPSTQRPAHARRDAEKRARNHPYNEQRPARVSPSAPPHEARPAAKPEYAERKPAPRPSANNQTDESGLPRLSKRMAELGLCSRREADEWISNGWVSVDGVVIDTLGTRISPTAKIEVSETARKHQSENVTILLHKPIGYVSGQAEDGYQPAIVLINPENQWQEEGQQQDPTQPKFKRGHLQGLAPAGRLDIDSTGLLVFTQDGRVARQLIGENSTVEKEYLVRVEGELSATGLKKLNHGLELDGVMLKPAKVSWQNEDQLRFVLREGRKRQIRRMCELVGLTVTGLKRVRIGSVSLGKLPLGTWRYLRLGERF
jgi:23S rRNA pseudouridine2604 synthase